jgi:hypothetical protein
MQQDLTASKILLALAGILYGVFKIAIGLMTMFLPDSVKKRLQGNAVGKTIFSDDHTLAGRAIEVALVIFGVYTLTHGLDALGLIDTPFIHSREFIYTFYTVIGLVLVVFYSLVIYTSLPIPKGSDMMRYKLIGLVGGLLFLIMTPLYAVYYQLHDHSGAAGALTSGFGFTFAALLAVLLMVGAMVLITYDAFVTKRKNDSIHWKDFLTFIFIPLGFI